MVLFFIKGGILSLWDNRNNGLCAMGSVTHCAFRLLTGMDVCRNGPGGWLRLESVGTAPPRCGRLARKDQNQNKWEHPEVPTTFTEPLWHTPPPFAHTKPEW